MDYLHSTVFSSAGKGRETVVRVPSAKWIRHHHFGGPAAGLAGTRYGLSHADFKLIKKSSENKMFFRRPFAGRIRTDYQSAPPAHSMPMAATDARPTATIASKKNTDTDIITSEC